MADLKEEIKEAIEFVEETGHFDLKVPADESYISLAEAVSEVLDESGISHTYNQNFIELVEEAREEILKEREEEIGWEEETFTCKRCGRLFPANAEWAYGLCEDCYYKEKERWEKMEKEYCGEHSEIDL